MYVVIVVIVLLTKFKINKHCKLSMLYFYDHKKVMFIIRQKMFVGASRMKE